MCSKGLAKCFLFVFNSIFFLLGLAILVIGVVILLDDSVIMQALSYVPSNDVVSADDVQNVLDSASFLESAAIAIIVLGSIVFVIGFCGCVGAVKESKCLLGIYGAFVLVILLAQLTAGILAYLFQDQAKEYLSDYLDSTLTYSYQGMGLDSSNNIQVSDDLITSAWDLAQITFDCCGVNSYTEYASATAWNSTYTYSGSSFTAVVPATCCKLNGAGSFPSGLSGITFVDELGCMENTWANATNLVGCYPKLESLFTDYAMYIAGGGIGIALLELIGIIAAFCLIKSFNKVENMA